VRRFEKNAASPQASVRAALRIRTHLVAKMALRKNAPTNIVWMVCLVLYLVALLAHFRIVHLDAAMATWSWIIGFGLMLVATKVRRL
jgi:hypothetical protein